MNYYLQPEEKKNTLQEHRFINTISNGKKAGVALVTKKAWIGKHHTYISILPFWRNILPFFIVRFSIICVHPIWKHYMFIEVQNFGIVNWFILCNQPNIGGIDAMVEHLLLVLVILEYIGQCILYFTSENQLVFNGACITVLDGGRK